MRLLHHDLGEPEARHRDIPQRQQPQARAAAAGAIVTQYVQAEVSIDDHVRAVLMSPAACRRVLRDLRERQDAGELDDSRWSSVAEELQRTRPQPRSSIRWSTR